MTPVSMDPFAEGPEFEAPEQKFLASIKMPLILGTDHMGRSTVYDPYQCNRQRWQRCRFDHELWRKQRPFHR